MRPRDIPARPAAARLLRLGRAAAFLLSLAALPATAQVIEVPIPFDSDGRVVVMTPALQVRLGVASDVLHVPPVYREARLYAVRGGEYVVASQLPSGEVSRTTMTAAAHATMRTTLDAALTAARNPVSMDDPTIVSEPVREPFVVHQTVLGLLLYGPAAAVLVNEPVGSTAAYLAVAGGSFFWSYGLSRSTTITRAQNHLAWHVARRGAGTAMAATYILGAPEDEQAYAAAALVGGIGGAVAGVKLGRPYTDAEAHAMTFGSTMAGVTALGTMAAIGQLGDNDGQRGETALITGAAIAGFPVGLRYARRAAYTITAGDVGTMVTSGLIGAGAAMALTGMDGVDANLVTAGAAAGAVAGALAGDRMLVRRFDHTVSQSNILRVGAGAGALLGLALSVPFEPDDERVPLSLATIGAAIGATATHALMAPRRATDRGAAPAPLLPTREEARHDGAGRGTTWSVHLDAAALAAIGTPGRHALLRITF